VAGKVRACQGEEDQVPRKQTPGGDRAPGGELSVGVPGNFNPVDQVRYVGQSRTIDALDRHAAPKIRDAGEKAGRGHHPGPGNGNTSAAAGGRDQIARGQPPGAALGQIDGGKAVGRFPDADHTAQIEGCQHRRPVLGS